MHKLLLIPQFGHIDSIRKIQFLHLYHKSYQKCFFCLHSKSLSPYYFVLFSVIVCVFIWFATNEMALAKAALRRTKYNVKCLKLKRYLSTEAEWGSFCKCNVSGWYFLVSKLLRFLLSVFLNVLLLLSHPNIFHFHFLVFLLVRKTLLLSMNDI